jgi:carbamoyl-phosphate synthase large subunit
MSKLENDAIGLGYYGKSLINGSELVEYIKTPKWDRIFRIKDALMQGVTVKTIAQATGMIVGLIPDTKNM